MWKTLLIVAVLSETAHAQLAYVQHVQQECVVLGCVRYSTYGSAVAVARANGGTVFLTAEHVLQSKSDTSQTVGVYVAGTKATVKGKWNDGRATDLAILWIPGSFHDVVPLETEPVRTGEGVIAGGFDFAAVSGQKVKGQPVPRYYVTKITKAERNEFGNTDRSWPVGMSGGSIVRRGGGLVGIICHSNGFNINWDYQKFIRSHYPDAQFAEVAPLPPPTDEPKPRPSTDEPEPPPSDKLIEKPVVTPPPTDEPELPPSDEPKENPAVVVPQAPREEDIKKIIGTIVEEKLSKNESSPKGSWFTSLAGLVGTAAGGPAGGALATGAASVGVFLYRQRKRRKDEASRGVKQVVTESPLPGDAVAAPSRVQTAHPIAWQNVDSNLYARAHDEARRVIGARYPGAQEVLEAELSLTRQYVSGTLPMPNTQPTRN